MFYDKNIDYFTVEQYQFSSEEIFGNKKTDGFFPFSVLFKSDTDINRNFYIMLNGEEYDYNKNKVLDS